MKVPPPVNSAIILGGSAQQRHMAFTASWSWSMFLRTGSLAHLGTSWHILAHLGTESEGDIRGPPAGCHPFQGDPVECSTLKQMGMSQRTQKSMNIYEHRTQRCNASNVLRISSNQIHHTMQSIQDFLVFLSSFNIFYFNIFQLTGWIPSFSQLGSIGNQFHQDGLLPVRSCFPGIRKRHVHFFWSCQRILSNQAQRGNINSMELGLCVTPVAIATAKPQFCQGFVHAGQGSIYDGNQGISHACGRQPTNRCQTRNIEPRAIELRWGWNIW